MDGGGRLDQPLVRRGKSDARQLGALGDEPGSARRHAEPIRRRARHWGERLMEMPLPRGVGIIGSILLLAATLGYGAVAGQHVPDVINWFKDARDIAANSLGFRIAAIALAGEKEVSREEVLTTAGGGGRDRSRLPAVSRCRRGAPAVDGESLDRRRGGVQTLSGPFAGHDHRAPRL